MKKQLTITNLHVQTQEGKKILNGVSLKVNPGEIHVIMGPNGGGKSTFAQALMGHPGYIVTAGKVKLGSKDITKLSPDKKAQEGLFLGFQYPVEVAGVNFASFLRMAANEHSDKKLSPISFRNLLEEKSKPLMFNEDLSKRSLNEGFSGGEKKKAEILQLSILKPDFAVLDEPDSGLDVDALRYISKAINSLDYHPGIILITHYQRILRFIKADFVHVMIKGRLVKSGDAKIAREIEEKGYEHISA